MPFDQGNTVRLRYIDYYDSADLDNRDIRVANINLERGIYAFSNVLFLAGAHIMVAEGNRIFEEDPAQEKINADVIGLGFTGFIHIDFLSFRSNSIFADYGFGVLFTNDNFPPGGTAWNYTQGYGLGVSVNLFGDTNIILGARHLHLSNGKGFGHPRNPSYDGDGGYVGVIFEFQPDPSINLIRILERFWKRFLAGTGQIQASQALWRDSRRMAPGPLPNTRLNARANAHSD